MDRKDLTAEVGDGILNVRVGAIIMKDNKFLMVGNERSDYLYSVGGRVKILISVFCLYWKALIFMFKYLGGYGKMKR